MTPLAALLAGRAPGPDLAFATNRDSRVFPRYLLARSDHNVAGLARGLRE